VDDVTRTLADLGRHLELPADGDPAAAAVARIRGHDRRSFVPASATNERRTGVLVVAAAVIVAIAVVLAAPGPRGAVARLLGVDGIEITRGEVDPTLSRALELGRPIAVDAALDEAGGVTVPGLGPPDGAYAGRPRDGVSLVWAASDDLPAIAGTDTGAVLTVFPADAIRIGKVASDRTGITDVRVGGHRGYWIGGEPHEVVYEAPDSRTTSARLAGNTLIWSDGERAYRLESALDRADALAAVSPGG
jgi:hypothetical protein